MRPPSSLDLLSRLPHAARVLIIRLRSLGDCVLTTPAISILKQTRPDLKLAVVVENRFRAVFLNNPAIDSILPPSLFEVVRWRPHLSLNLHGGTRSALLTAASLARYCAGFQHFRAAGLYNVPIPRAQAILGQNRVVHTAEHVASAMFYLGAPLQTVPKSQLFVAPGAGEFRGAKYALIHPFAATLAKTWPPERYREIASHLQEKHSLEPVFLAGPGESTTAFSGHRVISGLPLEQTKKVISGASLFIGNDSGPAHMAAAFSIPSVVLFGTSNPAIWGPWRVRSEVLQNPDINSIGVDGVRSAIDRLRSDTPAGRA